MSKGYLSHRRTVKAQASLRIRTVYVYGTKEAEEPHLRPHGVHMHACLKDHKLHDPKVPFLMRWLKESSA